MHFLTFLTSGPLLDKQHKTVGQVENTKFSWESKLKFIFCTCLTVFCCLSTRRPDLQADLLLSLHFWWSWPTVRPCKVKCTQGLIETKGLMVIFDENQVISDLNKYEFLHPIYIKMIKFLVIWHHFDCFYFKKWPENP